MKKRLTLRLKNSLGLSTFLVTLFLVLGINPVKAQASFGPLGFTGGSSQSLVVCENSIATSINSLMSIDDTASGITETWSVTSGPAHGTISLSSSVDTYVGLTLSPSASWTFTPSSGFSGSDAFVITVSNGVRSTSTTINVTINPLPSVAAITGTLSECVGNTTTLSNATAGGTWFTGDASIASVTPAGLVRGISGGTTDILYSVTDGTTGCTNIAFATDTVLTVPSVAAISGATAVCVGGTTLLTDATTGTTVGWSSSNNARATVDAGGNVFGVSAGSVTITYSVTNSCGTGRSTNAMTVETGTVASITPSTAVSVCIGSTTTLADVTIGGSWGTADATIASVNPATGVVTGVAVGTVNIIYTLTNSCGTNSQTKSVTVITIPSVPSSITGTTNACVGASSTLSDGTSGGAWTSSNPSIASVNAVTGSVIGVAGGTATITYTVVNSCGSNFTTTSFTVNTIPAVPSAITGATSVCVASTITLSDATSGGLWSSSNPTVSTVDAGTGVVSGLVSGVNTISYTVTNTCGSRSTTYNDTVRDVPATPASISGLTTVCVGSNISLTDATSGGAWSSSSPSVASVSLTGSVHGLSIGSTTISYSLTNFCGTSSATSTITVNDVPVAPATPTGTSPVCIGSTTTFTDGTSGGNWTSSNISLATISSSGVVTPIATGTVTISYTLSNACGLSSGTASLTINDVPSVPAIGGTTAICTGSTTTLTDALGGGTWTSGTPSIASISTSGVVTSGATAGSSIITYTASNACGSASRTVTVTVTAPPSSPASITGATQVCVGGSQTLLDATSGGTWSSTTPSVASVSSSGVVFGLTTGSTTISYTISNFCGTVAATLAMTGITVPAPPAITGANAVCVGGSITLADGLSGGQWFSVTPAIASVDISTGNVTGVSAGTVTITYIVTNPCGSAGRSKSITVSGPPSTPPAIGGPASVCVGSVVTETNTTGGGAWTTADPSIASISSVTATTFGVAAGTTTITYTVTGACGSSFVTRSFTVNTVPSVGAISGTSPMCAGTTATFTDTSAGGTWTTQNASLASVNIATGLVTAVTTGTVNISYTKTNVCGSTSSTFPVTVTTVPGLPAAITAATTTVCVGASVAYSDATAGGTWTSSNAAIATVDGSGNVYGVSGGSATISYFTSNSCGSSAARTKAVTVNTTPTVAAIGGTTSICNGNTTTLTDATGGGVWTTSDATIASINSASALVRAMSPGSVTISYTVTNGCGPTTTTRTFTVLTVPATPPAITGTTSLCVSSTTALADSVTGGTWTSSAIAVASVNSATGLVFGVSGGTATITYTVTNSCGSTSITTTVTVNTVPAAPPAITGSATVCSGGTTTLSDATSGGVWSSSLPGVATVDPSSGVVTGLSAGSAATISYTVSNGCGPTSVTKAISVITLPSVAAISGTTTVCVGATTTLSDATGGGSWSSSDVTIATVNSATGVVTGVSGTPSGTAATITYSVTNSCGTTTATRTISVITTPAAPAAISGTFTICRAASTSLSDATSGGVWSSSNTGIATISNSGLVFGSSAGTATISYTVSNSCGPTAATATMTVVDTPVVAPITGPTTECISSSVTLSSATSGGTWVSSNPSVATVSTSGTVTGASVGTTLIIYSITNVCGTRIQTAHDTVINGTVPAITGAGVVCRSASTTLSNALGGGTWSSSNFTIATVNSSTGVVTGVSSGNVTITYSVTSICGTNISVHSMTIDTPGVAAITGTTTVCEASSVTLSDATPGGTWSTLDGSIASVNSSTGVVTGNSAGTVSIGYSVTNSCGPFSIFTTVTVNPLPHAGTITGTPVVCVSSATSLADATASGAGTWSSSDVTTATISTTGVVTGVAAGTATVTYSVTNSCGTDFTTITITVNPLPNAGTISGLTDVCEGSSITLTDAATGGSWSTSDGSIASVTGPVVSGVAAGTATISYSVTNSCGTDVATYGVTVHPLPVLTGISGITSICASTTSTLSNSTGGGTWATTNAAVASVDASSGMLYGVSAGTAVISYTVVSAFSCSTTVTTTVTINPLPVSGTISGPTTVCEGSFMTLTDGATGGSWSTSITGNANVGGTGVVNGLTAGIDTVFYTVTNGCGTSVAMYPITVNPLPHAGTILGTGHSICQNDTLELSSTVSGGTWNSTSLAIASVESTTGIVTGVGAGTTTISYKVTNSCGVDFATYTVVVRPLPNAGTITGPNTVCETSFITLNDGAGGGTWSSSSTGNATVSTSGIVTGITPGTDTIFYTVTNSCGTDIAHKDIVVRPLPHAGNILGANSVCVLASITLTDTATGGTWTSSLPGTATVSSGGVVTGVSAGVVSISYAITNTCGTAYATHTVTVNPLPSAGTILGTNSVCVGFATGLSNATSGGSYTSSDTTIAKVNSASGVVTGISSGLAIISYSVTNGCGTAYDTMMVRVNPVPNPGTISGPSIVCVGSTISLSDAGSVGTFTWASSNTGIATVSAFGVVHGVSAGTVTIKYLVSNSCGNDSALVTITVNPLPAIGSISGPTSVCTGSSITLVDTFSGGTGTWSVTPGSIATIGSGPGIINGISAGSATVSYTVTNSCGTLSATYAITVNASPNAGTITGGAATVCIGSNTAAFSDFGSVGSSSWSTTNTSIATINNVTRVVHGVAVGIDTVVYTVTTASCGSASTSVAITVLPTTVAGTIYGPSAVCAGNAISLGDTTGTTAGTWSSSSAIIASVNSSTGDVTGVSGGIVTITYTVTTACGTATTTHAVTVTPTPSAGSISGSSILCEGATAVLTDAAAGGIWTSSDSTVASIIHTGAGAGTVTGVAAGTVTITYTVTNACATVYATSALTVSPLPLPGVITPGTYSLCQFDSTALTDTATGGTWSSASSGIASVSASGEVYGVSGGTAIIHYCKTNSCGTVCANATITVNPAPNAGAITGASSVCESSTTTLHDFTGTAGGAWSSSDLTIASINGSTGLVTGVAAGTVTMSYIVSTASCGSDTATFTMTVNPLPHAGPITGAGFVCTGATLTLSDTATLGSWSVGSALIATVAAVSGGGDVTGVSVGTTTISYTVINGCGTDIATHAVTVRATPTAGTIVGPTTLCPGVAAHITLSDPTGTVGGVWSSSLASIATVDTSTGVVTGVSGGVVSIVYTASTAFCGTVSVSRLDTVFRAPVAGTIFGGTTVCNSSYVSLYDTSGYGFGSWSSFAPSIASIDGSGLVYGTSVGTTTITYSTSNICGTAYTTYPMTVLALPHVGSITGATTVCQTDSTTFTVLGTTVGALSWLTTDGTVAGIGNITPTTAHILGVSGGSATIYLIATNSCGADTVTKSITVNPLPAFTSSITGSVTNICIGAAASTTLGAPTVSYATSTSWSGGSGHATVSSTGVVTGTSAGTAIITYSATNACGTTITTYTLTVDPSAVAGTISGPTNVCVGSTISLSVSGSVGSGAWSSPTATYVTVDASGNVYGVAVGSETITYTATTVCSSSYTTVTINVRPLPDAGTLSGYTAPFCAGDSIYLTSTVSGGVWTCSPTAVATIGTTSGHLVGVGGGSVIATYTVTSAYCGSASDTISAFVNPLPVVGGIGGTYSTSTGSDSDLCIGGTYSIFATSYLGTSSAGVWSTSSAAIASVNYTSLTGTSTSNATLYAVAVGTATITFAVTNGCGTTYVVKTYHIHPLPNPGTISGPSLVCVGSTASTAFTSSGSAGGTWTTSGGASITGAGVITGSTVGTTVVTYSVSTTYCGSASDTALISVLAPPHASIITIVADTICEGSTTTVSDSVSGGTWSSSNPTIASVTSAGVVIGVAAGPAIIHYTLSNPCGTDIKSLSMVVNPLPHGGTVTGASSLCVGTPVTLTSTSPGGTWSASNTIATVTSTGSTTGSVLGSTIAGNDTIYYVVTNSCGTDTSIKVVTVNLLPNAGHITAAQNFICGGDSLTVTDTVTGGFWTSSNAAVGPIRTITTSSIPSTAEVYGITAGITVIKYNFVNYCGVASDSIIITVRPTGHCYDDVPTASKSTEVGIYPNPVVSNLHIDAPVKVNVTVISPDGKVVLEQKDATDIDVSNLASGLYMIMVYDESNTLLKASRFIKAQ